LIFNHRPVEQLAESDLLGLIGLRENEHIEFKVTYNLFGADAKTVEEEKYELLKDIASLANAGGGYIFVGVRADKNSVAVKFESIPDRDLERMKQSILALCVDHIEERITGLEVKHQVVSGSNLVVIRVPSSTRIPHMIKFKNNTHFTSRYQDGKREMTLAEIRNDFNNDITGRRLHSIETLLNGFKMQKHNSMTTDIFADDRLNESTDGKFVAQASLDEFKQSQPLPSLYLGIGPVETNSKNLELTSSDMNSFLRSSSSADRTLGWNMELVPRAYEVANSSRITMGEAGEPSISLLANGYLSFNVPLTKGFCWGQSEDEYSSRPRFSPYAVVEFPVSFFRMYKRLIEKFSVKSSKWCVVLCYYKPKGFFLAPGHPLNPFFDSGNAKMYSKANDLVITDVFEGPFEPDRISYQLVSKVYKEFGFTEHDVPFYIDEQKTFKFS